MINYQEWAAFLPAGALSNDSDGQYIIHCGPLTGGNKASIVPAMVILLESTAKTVKAINKIRNDATPQLSELTIISKSIEQADSSDSGTDIDPTRIKITYTFSFELGTDDQLINAIDPVGS